MITMREMAEAILKTYRHTDPVSRDVCSHCNQFEEASLWVIAHSPDCIVLKCEHLKKMQEISPSTIDWSQYKQAVGRAERVGRNGDVTVIDYRGNVMMENVMGGDPIPVSNVSQLREYHANAVKNLTHYADDSGLRESDVKHYRKRAAFHQTMVDTIDQAMGEPK
jgi:hypothetical protein